MATFTNIDKSSAPSWSNASKNSSTFANSSKSDQTTTFGSLSLSQIQANTFDGLFQGRLLADWAFDDIVSSTTWSNQSKS